MSISPESVIAPSAPERGAADVDGALNIPVQPIVEKTPEEKEAVAQSLIDMRRAIRAEYGVDATPEPVIPTKSEQVDKARIATQMPLERGSLSAFAGSLPPTGTYYQSKADFGALLPENPDATDTTPLNESEAVLTEYLKSEYFSALHKPIVDMDAFNRPAPAFPDKDPRFSKVVYIVEDLRKALKNETNPVQKKALEKSIAVMQQFASRLKNVETIPEDIVKQCTNVLADPNSSVENSAKAKNNLKELTDRNINDAAAYRVIADYFPAGSDEGIISRNASPYFTEDYSKYYKQDESEQTASSEPALQTPEKVDATVPEGLEKDFSKAENKLVESYRKRFSSRVHNANAKRSRAIEKPRLGYSGESYKLFRATNSGITDFGQRLGAMIGHINAQMDDMMDKVIDNQKIADKINKRADGLPEAFVNPKSISDALKNTAIDTSQPMSLELEGKLWKIIQGKAYQSIEDLLAEVHNGPVKKFGKSALKSAGSGIASGSGKAYEFAKEKVGNRLKDRDTSEEAVSARNGKMGRVATWAQTRFADNLPFRSSKGFLPNQRLYDTMKRKAAKKSA